MIPIILEAMGALAEGGAAEGAAAEAGSVSGESVLGRAKSSDRIPDVLRNFSGHHGLKQFGETSPLDNIKDHSAATMSRISDLMTSHEEHPEAANDAEHIFGGKPDILGSQPKNHVVDMFKSGSANDNFKDPGNDNVKDAVVATLEPALKSIDRNTFQTTEQIKELNEKMSKFFADMSEKEFEKKEASAVVPKEEPAPANPEDVNDEDNDVDKLTPNEAAKKKKQDTVWGAVKQLAMGGLLKGVGSLATHLSGEPQSKSLDHGGYGADRATDPDIVAGNFTGRQREFLKTVSANEGAGYDTVYGNGKYGKPNKKLTDMTLDEVMAYQEKLRSATAGKIGKGSLGTSAVGKGQFVEGTLKDTLKSLGIKQDQWSTMKYTPELQNKLILQNALNHGIDPNRPETLRDQHKLGAQWESWAGYKMSSSKFNEQIDKIASASTAKEYVSSNPADGHWGKGFNPMASIKAKHSDSMLMTTRDGKHESNSIDITVPKGETIQQYIKELQTMFPGVAASAGPSNTVHLVFSGWNGASAIKPAASKSAAATPAEATGPKNGIGPVVAATSAKSSAKQETASNNNNSTTINNSHTSSAPTKSNGTTQRRTPPPAKPDNWEESWADYFGL